MPFPLTKARYHPLYGLEVTDDAGNSYLCGDKITVAEAGIAMFLDTEVDECPYQVRWEEQARTYAGTDDPEVVALLLKSLTGGLPFVNGWQNVPLGD